MYYGPGQVRIRAGEWEDVRPFLDLLQGRTRRRKREPASVPDLHVATEAGSRGLPLGPRHKPVATCSLWSCCRRLSSRTPQVGRRPGSDGDGRWRILQAGAILGGRTLAKPLLDPLG